MAPVWQESSASVTHYSRLAPLQPFVIQNPHGISPNLQVKRSEIFTDILNFVVITFSTHISLLAQILIVMTSSCDSIGTCSTSQVSSLSQKLKDAVTPTPKPPTTVEDIAESSSTVSEVVVVSDDVKKITIM